MYLSIPAARGCCDPVSNSSPPLCAQVQNQQMQVVRQLEGATGSGPCKLHVRNLHVAMSVRASYTFMSGPDSSCIGYGAQWGHARRYSGQGFRVKGKGPL